jgi:hypothetical protein|tara:strand:- start:25 stop:795 length:771 start_codon:yes stop_codon:yes gene_type:complete
MAESQYGFPTEVLSLPSQGLLYPEDSPLRNGTIDVKYMTAKEEDILTSANLIQQGVVLDRLLESVIADKGIKLDDLLVGDKNALLLGTRILGYGKDYRCTITDPDTEEQVEHTIDLSTIQHKSIDEKSFENGNLFSFELPNSKRVLEFKVLTHGDEKKLQEINETYENAKKITGIDHSMTNRMKYQIVSIDGKTDQKEIDKFVDNEFLALDSRAFRLYRDKLNPDVEMVFDYTSQTGKKHKVDLPINVEFFWPAAE